MYAVKDQDHAKNVERVLRNNKIPFKGVVALFDGIYVIKVLSPKTKKGDFNDYDNAVYEALFKKGLVGDGENDNQNIVRTYPHTEKGIAAFKDETNQNLTTPDFWEL